MAVKWLWPRTHSLGATTYNGDFTRQLACVVAHVAGMRHVGVGGWVPHREAGWFGTGLQITCAIGERPRPPRGASIAPVRRPRSNPRGARTRTGTARAGPSTGLPTYKNSKKRNCVKVQVPRRSNVKPSSRSANRRLSARTPGSGDAHEDDTFGVNTYNIIFDIARR